MSTVALQLFENSWSNIQYYIMREIYTTVQKFDIKILIKYINTFI